MNRRTATKESVEKVLFQLIEHFDLDYHRGMALKEILLGRYGNKKVMKDHVDRINLIEPHRQPMPEALELADSLGVDQKLLPPGMDTDPPEPEARRNGDGTLFMDGEY